MIMIVITTTSNHTSNDSNAYYDNDTNDNSLWALEACTHISTN